MQQSPLQTSNSFGPIDQVFKSTYAAKHELLCADPEGWGPISSIRWDLTPCFLDVPLIFVAVWGIVGGAGALWYLFKKRSPQEVPKNWHYYAKMYLLNQMQAVKVH